MNGEYICYDGDEGDYIVTSIGSRAFNSCTTLTTVFIPRSVTSIAEDGVFAYCTSLTTINVDENNTKFRSEDGILYEGMPGNLGQLVSYPAGKTDITYSINIGHVYAYAFAGNKYLQNISFTGFLQSIGEYSFDKCANIKNIAISTSPFKISTVNIELDSTTIKDTALMAEYLTNTYCTYRWSYCGDTDIN